MKYFNAASVLPKDLVERLQEFVQGEYLYIPAKKGHFKSWGEMSGSRKGIDERNREISNAYSSGLSIEEISEAFFLSTHSIRKIIYKK